jgi:hypothetical protein
LLRSVSGRLSRETPVRTRHSSMFGYSIRREGAAWAWAAFDMGGVLVAAGRAPTKAIAAACVIHAHARRSRLDDPGAARAA